MRHLRAGLRLFLFLLVSLSFAALYTLTLPLARRWQLRVQQRWCAATARVAGLRVRRVGEPRQGERPTIFLVNHVSYLDIPAFGSLVPATFVAKSEVASWPLFGWFARLTGTLFIPRRVVRSADQVRLLKARLERGESLILFPEGTHSDGSDVLPFKSSLLASAMPAATGLSVRVQPVSLGYLRLVTGEPLVGARRGLYAWVGFDDMFPHLWRALGLPGADVEIRFHEPLTVDSTITRKTLARVAETTVRDGVRALWRDVRFDRPLPEVAASAHENPGLSE